MCQLKAEIKKKFLCVIIIIEEAQLSAFVVRLPQTILIIEQRIRKIFGVDVLVISVVI